MSDYFPDPKNLSRGAAELVRSKTLTFAKFSEANRERCQQAFHPIDSWSPQDWATAVAGEVGEACNLIKKMRRGEPIPKHDIADEIADAVTYLDLLAQRLGIDLGEAVLRKFNVVSERRDCGVRL